MGKIGKPEIRIGISILKTENHRCISDQPFCQRWLPGACALILFVSACTTTSEIIIDPKGVNMTNYEQDLVECQSYSEQVAVGEKAARGAASGAVVGGAVGSHRDTAEGAAIGAITGGASGINAGERDKVRVVKNCLRGRGYRVLN